MKNIAAIYQIRQGVFYGLKKIPVHLEDEAGPKMHLLVTIDHRA